MLSVAERPSRGGAAVSLRLQVHDRDGCSKFSWPQDARQWAGSAGACPLSPAKGTGVIQPSQSHCPPNLAAHPRVVDEDVVESAFLRRL